MVRKNKKSIAVRNRGKIFLYVTDKHCVEFVADEIMQYYPKAVLSLNGFTDFKTLDVDQIYKTRYGCVKKIIADKESLEVTVSTQFTKSIRHIAITDLY